MTSRGIRGTTLTSMRSNVENEVGAGQVRGKTNVTEAIKGRVTRTRGAMTDIGNRAAILQNGQNKGIKKEILKPARGLTKQKASTTLKQLPEVTSTRVTRRSAELKEQKAKEEVKNDDVEMEEIEKLPGYSTNNLGPVEDIDKDDVENPQLVVDYVNEIYAYLRHLENVQNVRENYLSGKTVTKTAIVPKMRAVLVDWLVQVHQQFNLLQETLYLTIAIIDRFLQDFAHTIDRKQLQLVGVAAMFIASKYEEMYAPEIGDFVYITDRAYTESQIRDMEMKILNALGFDLGRPLPLHFLRRNSKAANVDALTHTLAKYVMELTLVNYEMAHWEPSKLAAAALALSLFITDEDDTSLDELWTPTLVHYTTYSLDSIRETVQELASWVWETTKQPDSAKLLAIRKKYEDKKLSKIAKIDELTGQAMETLINGDF